MSTLEVNKKKKPLHCRLGYHPNLKYKVDKPDRSDIEGKIYWIGKAKAYCADCGIFMGEETWH